MNAENVCVRNHFQNFQVSKFWIFKSFIESVWGRISNICKAGSHDFHLIPVDAINLNGISSENLGITVCDSTIAYLIFTSGSTGVPKGKKSKTTKIRFALV